MKAFHLICLLSGFVAVSCNSLQDSYLRFSLSSAHEMKVDSLEKDRYHIVTKGSDPYISMNGLTKPLAEGQSVLTFEYSSSEDVNFMEIFFISKETGSVGSNIAGSQKFPGLAATDSMAVYAVDLGEAMETFKWNSGTGLLRLDFGDRQDISLSVRNIRFRVRNEDENAVFMEKEAFRAADRQADDRLASYLSNQYGSAVTDVEVGEQTVRIQGTFSAGGGKATLYAVKPWEKVTALEKEEGVELTQSPFSVEVERYTKLDGFRYDHALTKWVLVKDGQLLSGGRYADQIKPIQVMSEVKPAGRKGLGGYHVNRGFASDLTDFPVTSVTVNIAFTGFMYADKRDNAIAHAYGGKTYYFDAYAVDGYDRTLREAARHNIVVAAIILVNPASQCADPEIGRLLQDEHFGGEHAFFTMPNMSTQESVQCYAAALDFLASRYCRADNQYGRIHHWIMHNEVDAGHVWTNMGKNRPLHVFLDAYYKSMRLCYHIARQYDAHSEVLGSFTHSWTQAVPVDGDYATLSLIRGLLDYSRLEGDFEWGLACHPYPEDLNEPKTWNDRLATFSMNTPLVTFKNLEVLDKWIKLPENKYLGVQKRTLWLSENGTNSRSYSEQDLREQAAGFAYTWKKMKHLDGIDAFQWHNWIDGRGEFGLRIGLRKFPDHENEPGGKKPVWYVYQAAGTEREDQVFDPYKSVIGISDWSEVIHKVE
jgi:hypothetical protein